MSYWYIEGADGKHYCWAKEPSFECPIGSATELGDILTMAAEEIGFDPTWLLRRIKHAAYRKRDESGRLTDACETCGHRLDRLGFACWIEVPADESEQVAGFRMVGKRERHFYVDTKAKAERWARREVQLTKETSGV